MKPRKEPWDYAHLALIALAILASVRGKTYLPFKICSTTFFSIFLTLIFYINLGRSVFVTLLDTYVFQPHVCRFLNLFHMVYKYFIILILDNHMVF